MAKAVQETTAVAGRLCRELEAAIGHAWKGMSPEFAATIPLQLRIPHLSFQLVEGRLTRDCEARLSRLARRWPPIQIGLQGLGHFDRPRSVIYVSVKRSRALVTLQSEVTEILTRGGYHPHLYYRPEVWVPHISLAFDQPTRQWERLLQLDREGVFHRSCRLEGLVVLSADATNPVVIDEAFRGEDRRPPAGSS